MEDAWDRRSERAGFLEDARAGESRLDSGLPSPQRSIWPPYQPVSSPFASETQQATWARELRRITERVKGGTPELFTKAVRAWGTHGPTFKGKTGAPYPNPFRKDFEQDIQHLMRQLLSETIQEYHVIEVS